MWELQSHQCGSLLTVYGSYFFFLDWLLLPWLFIVTLPFVSFTQVKTLWTVGNSLWQSLHKRAQKVCKRSHTHTLLISQWDSPELSLTYQEGAPKSECLRGGHWDCASVSDVMKLPPGGPDILLSQSHEVTVTFTFDLWNQISSSLSLWIPQRQSWDLMFKRQENFFF